MNLFIKTVHGESDVPFKENIEKQFQVLYQGNRSATRFWTVIYVILTQ